MRKKAAKARPTLTEVGHDEHVIGAKASYIDFTGSLSVAVFLDNCVFWTVWAENRGMDGFYRTHAEWKEKFRLSREQVDGARSFLEPHGLLTTWSGRKDGHPIVYYRIELDELEKQLKRHKKDGKPLKRLVSLRDWYKKRVDDGTCVINADDPGAFFTQDLARNLRSADAYITHHSPYTAINSLENTLSKSAREKTEPESVCEFELETIALEPELEPEPIVPKSLEPDQSQHRSEHLTLVAKEEFPVGEIFPPAPPQQSATILPFNANSAANFDARWTLSQRPYILRTSPLKFHPALEAAVVMAYGDLYRMANGQANVVKVRSFLRNRTGTVEGLQSLDDLWEQAERTATGETTPLDHLAAKAAPVKETREQFWDSIEL